MTRNTDGDVLTRYSINTSFDAPVADDLGKRCWKWSSTISINVLKSSALGQQKRYLKSNVLTLVVLEMSWYAFANSVDPDQRAP